MKKKKSSFFLLLLLFQAVHVYINKSKLCNSEIWIWKTSLEHFFGSYNFPKSL